MRIGRVHGRETNWFKKCGKLTRLSQTSFSKRRINMPHDNFFSVPLCLTMPDEIKCTKILFFHFHFSGYPDLNWDYPAPFFIRGTGSRTQTACSQSMHTTAIRFPVQRCWICYRYTIPRFIKIFSDKKHAYYRYTIPHSKVLDMLPLHHTTLYKDLLGQEVCILPLYDSPIKGARYAIVVSRRQLAVLIGWLHHFPLHFG